MALTVFLALLTTTGMVLAGPQPIAGAVIIDGNQIVPAGVPISLPAGSVSHIVNYGAFFIVVVTTPGGAGGGGGGGGGPNPNVPRIELPPPPPGFPPPLIPPPGHVFEIPQPNHISSIRQVFVNPGVPFDVVVTYDDGATATVPGTLLSPGQPNPSGTFPIVNISMGGTPDPLAPADALSLFTAFVSDPAVSADLGQTLTLADFAYDFSGTTPFPAFIGPLIYTYADGTTATIDFSVPEPPAGVLLASCAAVVGLARRRGAGRHRTG